MIPKIHLEWRFPNDDVQMIPKNPQHLAFSPGFIWTFQVRRKPLEEATANNTDSKSDSSL